MRYEIKDVFHPSDFTRGSEAAFVHALRIALGVKGRLEVFHSESPDEFSEWENFPSVVAYLRRWKLIPPNGGRDAVAELGLYYKRIQAEGPDPCSQISTYLDHHRADLIVFSTHQRQGLARWMHRAIAEPIARTSGAMTLFIPRSSRGFVSRKDGVAHLSNILIPVDTHPAPQRAVDAVVTLVYLLCRAEKVTFTLLYAGIPDNMPKVRIPPRTTWQVIEHCVEGEPGDVILDAVEHFAADLVVMATHGKKGFLDALRGSCTDRESSSRCTVSPVGSSGFSVTLARL